MAEFRHPAVFVFLGETGDAADEILRQAEDVLLPGGVFSLCVKEKSDKDIRSLKARIQAIESGFSLKRVHVYIVAAAADQNAELAETAGRRLCALFREDFAAAHLTLVVLINESNSEADLLDLSYETRTAATFRFLSSLSELDAYDRIFLLSDRDERDVVSPANRQKALTLAAHLPLLHGVPSMFNELMAAKAREQGRVLFASAGFWRQKKPKGESLDISARNALKYLSLILEQNLAAGARESYKPDEEPAELAALFVPPEQIISDISGVAAKPLRPWHVWRRSIREAEALLFGESAAQFFASQVLAYGGIKSKDTVEPLKMPLSQAAAREAGLRKTLSELENEISEQTQALWQKERTPYTARLFPSIDDIKDEIGECYVIRYELIKLHAAQTLLSSEHKRLEDYLAYIRGVIRTIKEMPLLQNTPEESGLPDEAETLAPLAVSLLRDDGLLREQHTVKDANGEPCLFRLIGGFTQEDLSRWKALSLFSAQARNGTNMKNPMAIE